MIQMTSDQENPDSPALDTRRWFLAGYLSAEPPYRDRHPSDLLELADRILTVLNELEPDYDPDE